MCWHLVRVILTPGLGESFNVLPLYDAVPSLHAAGSEVGSAVGRNSFLSHPPVGVFVQRRSPSLTQVLGHATIDGPDASSQVRACRHQRHPSRTVVRVYRRWLPSPICWGFVAHSLDWGTPCGSAIVLLKGIDRDQYEGTFRDGGRGA